MRKGYLYILECSNGTYFTGSTIDLQKAMQAHFSGKGGNHTKKYPPKALMYLESFLEINYAFRREKQIQNWSHTKKRLLIDSNGEQLLSLANAHSLVHYTEPVLAEK